VDVLLGGRLSGRQRLDRLARGDAHAIERPVVQQHPPEALVMIGGGDESARA